MLKVKPSKNILNVKRLVATIFKLRETLIWTMIKQNI